MKRFRPFIVVDNTRHPTGVLPGATKLVRRFARHALIEAYETSSSIILNVKTPDGTNPADLYEHFFAAVGEGVAATVLRNNVELRMPKALYEKSFTPAAAYVS